MPKDKTNEGQLLKAAFSKIRAKISVPFEHNMQGLSKSLYEVIDNLRGETRDLEIAIIKMERVRLTSIVSLQFIM